MTAEMTPNPHIPEVFDVECKAHAYERTGLTYAHALNSMKKHNREQHPDPILDLSALAAVVCDAWDEWQAAMKDGLEDPDVAHKATPAHRRFGHLMEAWTALTGLDEGGLAYAHKMNTGHPIHAAILPF